MRYSPAAILRLTGAALLAVGLVALIACGGSSGGSAEVADGASEGSSSTVHVSLNEWSISPAHGSGFEAGKGDAVIEIHNEGAAPHDLKIIKTDLPPNALPVSKGIVDLEAAGEIVAGADPLAGGEMAVEEAHLEPGNYVLVCSIPGHYQAGMTAALAVK